MNSGNEPCSDVNGLRSLHRFWPRVRAFSKGCLYRVCRSVSWTGSSILPIPVVRVLASFPKSVPSPLVYTSGSCSCYYGCFGALHSTFCHSAKPAQLERAGAPAPRRKRLLPLWSNVPFYGSEVCGTFQSFAVVRDKNRGAGLGNHGFYAIELYVSSMDRSGVECNRGTDVAPVRQSDSLGQHGVGPGSVCWICFFGHQYPVACAEIFVSAAVARSARQCVSQLFAVSVFYLSSFTVQSPTGFTNVGLRYTFRAGMVHSNAFPVCMFWQYRRCFR